MFTILALAPSGMARQFLYQSGDQQRIFRVESRKERIEYRMFQASRFILAGSLVCLLGATGCATKGFVRGELESMRTDMQAGDEHLLSEIHDIGNSAAEAMARADMAFDNAGAARDLALGNAGFEEVDSYEVSFGFDSFDLSNDAIALLDQTALAIAANTATLVDVYGFTDATGSAEYNIALGQKRAETVMRYLVARTPGQLSRYAAVSFGEEQPVDLSGTAAASRRVVVSLIARTIPREELTQTH